jgi:hypothetical protein
LQSRSGGGGEGEGGTVDIKPNNAHLTGGEKRKLVIVPYHYPLFFHIIQQSWNSHGIMEHVTSWRIIPLRN